MVNSDDSFSSATSSDSSEGDETRKMRSTKKQRPKKKQKVNDCNDDCNDSDSGTITEDSEGKPRAAMKQAEEEKVVEVKVTTAVTYPTSIIFPQSMDAKAARKKILRWSRDKQSVARGKWMAQYLMYKMERDRVHEKLDKCDYAKIKCVLDRVDRQFIKKEFKKHVDRTKLDFPEVSKDQVENFRILHNDVKTMKEAGTPYLHNWVNALVEGIFHEKLLYEAYYIQTVKNAKPREWENCTFHTDLENCPSEWDYTNLGDKGPISLYFPVGDTPIKLEIEHEVKATGRPRVKKTTIMELKEGDLLMYNTTACRHRTVKPDNPKTVPDRVNIVLTGIAEIMQIDKPQGAVIFEGQWPSTEV